MKNFSKKFFSKKINVVILSLILLALVGYLIYLTSNINQNAVRMNAASDSVYFPTYPTPNTQNKDAALIQKGEYLVKAGDCIACHTNTPARGPAFAGGLPMQTPFGVIYTPNITSDKKTGIGNWTDEQFIKAMHDGISPQGKNYYPAFPYPYFNIVTVDDLKAIKAYLDSIPAVNQPNRQSKMIFPFNWRFLQYGWKLLFFHPVKKGAYQNDPTKSAEWNRGAYLVQGLGHCGMCHTPSYHILSDKVPLGAPIAKYNLTGAQIQGYLAPNITHTNLGAISNEELVQIFTHDKLLGGGSVQGPMLEANHDSLIYLTREDLTAIGTYLKSVKSSSPPLPKLGSGLTGKPIYDSYCSGCHSTGVGGAPKLGDTARWLPLIHSGINKVYGAAITGAGGMPPRGTCNNCSDRDIKEAVDYMVAMALNPKQSFPQKPVTLTIADGQRIYQENCSVCHTQGFKNAPKLGDKEAWKPVIKNGFLDTYVNVETGRKGHPAHGACPKCTDSELVAAIKYMMQTGSTDKNYNLW